MTFLGFSRPMVVALVGLVFSLAAAQTWNPDDPTRPTNTYRKEASFFTLKLTPMAKEMKLEFVGHSVAEVKKKVKSVQVTYGFGQSRKTLDLIPKGDHYVIKPGIKLDEINVRIEPKKGDPESVKFRLK